MIKHLHDGDTNKLPGGGPLVFEEQYVNYIFKYIPKDDVRISVGTIPTSQLQLGNIITFALTFSLAQKSKKLGKNVAVKVALVDSGISFFDKYKFDNVIYQKNVVYTGIINDHMNDYKELLEKLNSHYGGMDYEIINSSDLNLHKNAPELIKKIINEQEKFSQLLFPLTKCLGLRVPCSHCGLADKNGIKNRYNGDIISFFCPNHGWHSFDLKKDNLQKLEYETPLRNLIRGILYTKDNKEKDIPYSWLRVTGSDHAGFYQEQLFYRGAAMLDIDIINSPLIVYSPLVTDWAGVKLSKAVFLRGEYKYLTDQGLDYFIDYRKFMEKFDTKGLEVLFDEIDLWLKESPRLFRHYTIFYFDELFKTKIK
ncbi:hypothetical protein F8M41_025739 [Gigaspora margarita]|uniref:Uncharacterized protein n=1 Tax=Gigaspora margarita TaxID=4874 RepID=A0A8H3XKL9_GIGMA|nr:hypothetical protein F8M41_025739 [Gigaspora margarita]